jgi:predicted O-methyltransferase YrrM
MPNLKSNLTRAIKTVARIGQKFGVNVTPNHFYSDIPDFNRLAADGYWREPWSMVGISGTDIERQAAFAADCCRAHADKLADPAIHDEACRRNGEGGYGPVEALFLYGFVRSRKPRRIVQIGCGVSTCVILQAVEHEPGYTPTVTCVEPYPTDVLRRESQAGRIRLIPEMAQKVSLESLVALESGDLLFVDSTHTVKPGSEVLRIVFEVLPRLKPGVFVHFHDIYFPYDFSPGILGVEVFTNRESALLQAFLAMNPCYRILLAQSMLHHAAPDRLRALIPCYRPVPMNRGLYAGEGHFPSAVYLQRTDAPLPS